MTYDGRQIANYILDYCEQHNRPITNLALQKILYFCHVWSLVKLNKPLIRHQFEAWQFGPVLQYVYHEFKGFDRSHITARAHGLNKLNGRREVVQYNFPPETTALLSNVVDFYSRLRASQLVELSHAADAPWSRVWNHPESVSLGMKIEDIDIIDYYCKANLDYRKFSLDRH